MTRLASLATTTVVALTISSCSMFSPTQELRQLELVFDNPKTAMPYSVAVSIGTRAPNGTHHQATGEVSQGGLVTALCRSIRASLEADGCNASYRDLDAPAENETGEQKLRRSMRQVIELPEGWTFVYARTDRKIGHENIANNGGSGNLVYTLRGAR